MGGYERVPYLYSVRHRKLVSTNASVQVDSPIFDVSGPLILVKISWRDT